MKSPSPIFTAHLLPILDQYLIDLLRKLSPSDWERPTLAPLWNVKDIAAHLLDGNLRTLSMLKDNYFGEPPQSLHSYADLVGFLNQLNADWVRAAKRLSPAILIDLLETTGRQYCDYISSLAPFETATFAVAWAGEQTSQNWFHVAREYTEKWHHQQQIRHAVGAEEVLYQPPLYLPYLDTSMRALPHHYRHITAAPNTTIEITVEGPSQYQWYLCYDDSRWVLEKEALSKPVCTIRLPYQIAWKLFTKGIDRQVATENINIVGNKTLGTPIFGVLAVMA